MYKIARQHMADTYGLDLQEVDELMCVARQTLEHSLCSLEDALAENDEGKAVGAAHLIKGTLLNMGLGELAVKGKEIEGRLRGNEMDWVVENKDGFVAGIRSLLDEMK